ncbi:MAG: GNAT family N-acetyltransferase [Pseudomonadota bacterium]
MITRIFKKDIAECAKLHSITFSLPPWSEEADYKYGLRHVKNMLETLNSFGFKYNDDEVIVGYIIGYIEEFADGRLLRIKELLVHPDFQRKTIGSHLMRHAEKYAREKDCVKIMLSTFRDSSANNFYVKSGYQEFDKIVAMGKIL